MKTHRVLSTYAWNRSSLQTSVIGLRISALKEYLFYAWLIVSLRKCGHLAQATPAPIRCIMSISFWNESVFVFDDVFNFCHHL
jgi:hypothetical protein